MSFVVPQDLGIVLAALGIDVDRVEGEEYYALCPMHEARTGKPGSHPSWSINAESGTHHCFSCDYSGHVVGLVADILDIDFLRARRWLRKAGIDLETAQNLPKFWEAPAAKERAKERDLEHVLRPFVQPPESALAKRCITAEAAAAYGLLWSEKERGWVLPIRLPDGTLLGYQFKRKRLMRNRPETMEKSRTLFGIESFRGGRAILLESPLDCAVLRSLGIKGALSSFGASVSDEQMSLLVERADEVILALDNDFAGRRETNKLITGMVWRRGEKPEETTKWSARIPMSVFDYGDVTEKDVGDMAKAGMRREIFDGLRNAKHSSELAWATKRRNSTTSTRATAKPARPATRLTLGSTSGPTRSGQQRSGTVARAIAARRKK